MSIDGLAPLPWWGYVLVTLALTQITIASVTLYLHRCQAHLAIELHPVVSHFFRFWLWITTGMITREWIAVHRKHHAHVETVNDPHSPQVHGIQKILWIGAFLYRNEAHNRETVEKYGAGAPDDWVERHFYTGQPWMGVLFMLIINTVLFGAVGVAIWLLQMWWIPLWAAGVINGIGHYAGYRNYELPDASRNIVPWGVWIGGEELHNNHHAYANSARFAHQPWEIDIGWIYIRLLASMGLARVNKTAPMLVVNPAKPALGLDTVKAVVNNRFQVMAHFVKDVLNNVCRDELRKTGGNRTHRVLLKKARRLMVREKSVLSEQARQQLVRALNMSPQLEKAYAMKQRLQEIWSRSAANYENCKMALEEWCRAAEASGIEALRDFSQRLKRYELAKAG